MHPSSLHFKSFYSGKTGRVVRRILQMRLKSFLEGCSHGMHFIGIGYAVPYMRNEYTAQAERMSAVMLSRQGAHQWPSGDKNLVCLAEGHHLPFAQNTVDRALIIHQLEFSHDVQRDLRELWRVLKPEGLAVIIVPNRGGLWARAENSPFGYGAPFTSAQIEYYLNHTGFEIERQDKALFFPPSSRNGVLKMAAVLETLGRIACPFFAGVHIMTVRKEIIAEVRPGSGQRVRPEFYPVGAPVFPQGAGRYKD